MPSHLDCLGFNIQTYEEFLQLTELTIANGSALHAPGGCYHAWQLNNGITLWASEHDSGEPGGLVPHFSSSTTQVVGLTSRLSRQNWPMDGAFEAWAAPKTTIWPLISDYFGDYPFIFDCPSFRSYVEVELPAVAKIQLAGFAHEIEIHTTDVDPQAPQEAGLRLDQEFFIPTGRFIEDEGGEPEALAWFGGTVLDSRQLCNPISGKSFTKATIQTYSMRMDIVMSPEQTPCPLQLGTALSGSFWLSGMILEVLQGPDGQAP